MIVRVKHIYIYISLSHIVPSMMVKYHINMIYIYIYFTFIYIYIQQHFKPQLCLFRKSYHRSRDVPPTITFRVSPPPLSHSNLWYSWTRPWGRDGVRKRHRTRLVNLRDSKSKRYFSTSTNIFMEGPSWQLHYLWYVIYTIFLRTVGRSFFSGVLYPHSPLFRRSQTKKDSLLRPRDYIHTHPGLRIFLHPKSHTTCIMFRTYFWKLDMERGTRVTTWGFCL